MKGRAVVAATTVVLTMFVTSAARAGTDVGPPGIQVSTPSPATFTSYGGIRLRAIGSLTNTADEYLGVADLFPAANRIEANFTVPRFVTNMNSGSTRGDCIGNFEIGTLATPAPNQVTLTWDRAAGVLTSRLVNESLDCTLVFRNFAQELANAEGWTLARAQSALGEVNALRVLIDGRETGSGIVLRDATVDGAVPLGHAALLAAHVGRVVRRERELLRAEHAAVGVADLSPRVHPTLGEPLTPQSAHAQPLRP